MQSDQEMAAAGNKMWIQCDLSNGNPNDINNFRNRGGFLQDMNSYKDVERWIHRIRDDFKPEFNVAIYENGEGEAKFYVLPWNGNTEIQSNPHHALAIGVARENNYKLYGYIHRHPTVGTIISNSDKEFIDKMQAWGYSISFICVGQEHIGFYNREKSNKVKRFGKVGWIIPKLNDDLLPEFLK